MSESDIADSWSSGVVVDILIHDSDDSQSPRADPPMEQQKVVAAAQVQAPIISSYNHKIRPLLDAIDSLRVLNVMKEGIQLPTIVVVGDQSSGKSSVLESLAGISLPRSPGICTRVPLIMRLKSHRSPKPELHLEYNDMNVPVEESDIVAAINVATDELAGSGKGISNTPITLVVKKDDVPDLTMVDLPGITRVPVHGQPQNIYEQIRDIIMEYITPEESIILNVLSATVDFSTCESIRMSQMVDKRGQRTLGVVTKADRAPEELLQKVNANDVNIGLGYVCVRNRIGDESYEEARREEARLFQTDPYLSRLDKSIVGVPVLAKKLVEIQQKIIAGCLPVLVKNINDKLSANVSELETMPKSLNSVADAMTAFMRIIGAAKESLKKLLFRGEFDEYLDDPTKHGTARLVEMLNEFSAKLQNSEESDPKKDFLVEEINALEDAKGIGLPNFLPTSAFLRILQRKVDQISIIPIEFAEKHWDYIDKMVTAVLMRHSEIYYQLKVPTNRAAHKLVEKAKEQSINKVKEFVQMEKFTAYTCNPDYMMEWNKLMAQQDCFVNTLYTAITNVYGSCSWVRVEGIGDIEVQHLRQQPRQVVQQAFDLKMRVTAYWKIVLKRLVDFMALHLQYSVHSLLNNGIEEIVNELMGSDGHGIEKMLVESPAISEKREKLKKSIKQLNESKEVVTKVMDKIAGYDDYRFFAS
ncbi:hypothetical protein PTKIN_Ptkin01aG0291100 [Pterospermum kingtungense]